MFVNKHFANFAQVIEDSQDLEYEILRVSFLYGHKHIGGFSNLHQCTFKYFQGVEKGCIGNEWVNIFLPGHLRTTGSPIPSIDPSTYSYKTNCGSVFDRKKTALPPHFLQNGGQYLEKFQMFVKNVASTCCFCIAVTERESLSCRI